MCGGDTTMVNKSDPVHSLLNAVPENLLLEEIGDLDSFFKWDLSYSHITHLFLLS